MNTISLAEFQRDLLGTVRRVEAGESLLVTDEDRPVAELRPVPRSRSQPRPSGLAAGAFVVPADFDAPLPDELLKEFEGR